MQPNSPKFQLTVSERVWQYDHMRLPHDVANEYGSFGHLDVTWLRATYVHVMKFVWKLRIRFCVVRTWADDGQAFKIGQLLLRIHAL